MINHLKNATSPYLLQHAENPVDWYTWCEEAFEKAKAEDKPIFLSIGYSTCHWCHVMAHESFEDVSTAEVLNNNFVSIKVDREERPDIDSVYMAVCQAFTGNGGWPTSIFMTSDKKPFYAGTYFPPESKYGMPGFTDLLISISEHWRNNRSMLLESSEKIIQHINNSEKTSSDVNTTNLIEEAVKTFSQSFDTVNGGFGTAPKFPSPHNLIFLTLYSKLNNDTSVFNMVDKTLMQMRKGGIFDHVGYGFSRYSTDKFFLAPHFEKMLYDNALLIIAYAAAYQISKNKIYLDTCEKVAEYIFREMTSPDGGFYSAQDADSEGIEGKYYTFTLDEIISVLGDEKGEIFAKAFDITEQGNFEDVNIPNLLKSNNLSVDFEPQIKALFKYRKNRTKLHLDDKFLTSWNSLMIIAMSMLYRISGNEMYINSAKAAQLFIKENLCNDIEIFTSFRNGKRSETGFLDDYAFYITALIELYNSTLDRSYLERAEQLCNKVLELFADDNSGGFYMSKTSQNELFVNLKESYDGAIPSGNSAMTYNLVRLFQITENEEYNDMAQKQIDYMSFQAARYPAGNSMFLLSLLIYENPAAHIVIVPKNKEYLQSVVCRLPALANVVIVDESSDYPILNDKTTYYVCKSHACLPPTNCLEGNLI